MRACRLQLTGERTDGAGFVQERPHLLESEACYKGCQTDEAHVLFVTLPYNTQCVCAEKKSQEAAQDKKLPSNGDKGELTIHFQNSTHSFWPAAV